MLREYVATVSRPQTYASPVNMETIVERVRLVERFFHIAGDTAQVTAELLGLLSNTPTRGKPVHDLTQLLTHNVADFQRFASRITITPLVALESTE